MRHVRNGVNTQEFFYVCLKTIACVELALHALEAGTNDTWKHLDARLSLTKNGTSSWYNSTVVVLNANHKSFTDAGVVSASSSRLYYVIFSDYLLVTAV